ncbi:MAG TPA: hypothetical protein EYH30_01895, partial [Anaerolineales bacterium]|nr:hypothetical protein [Anaerolineae bacterium]HIQ00878.1 hypothetical protein [Anaerolineales bacterium]
MPIWEDLIPLLRWGVFALFLLAAASVGASILYFRRARLAPYYILREIARQKGLRWLTVAAISLLSGTGLLYLRAHPPDLSRITATRPPLPPTATVATATV